MWFEQAVQASPDALLALDDDLTIRFINPAGLKLFEVPREQALHQPVSRLLPELDCAALLAALRQSVPYEADLLLPPATLCHLHAVGTPGGAAIWLKADHGGGRRDAEREGKQTSGTLRAIVDCSPVATVTTDAHGRIVLWNPAAERILGIRRDDMRGRESPLAFDPGVEVHDRECQVTRDDGAGIELLYSVAPMHDPAGELAGHVIMFSDVTERSRMNRQMEHSQRLESLGVLAGGVAHDFNNLLTGILGNASLCLYLLEDNAEATVVLKDLVRAGERAAGLTRQLLSYAGKGRFVVSRLNLSELAREMTGLARGSIQNNRVKLHLALSQDMPAVEADASQLQQVILNLVINGAESVPPKESGAVHIITQTQVLTESDEQNWVTSEVLPPGQYAVLEVRDNGAGMDEATRARIFEPFFSTKFTGRGLGLSAAIGIVRQHKGALSVRSEPGKGSSFRVFLPALAEPAPVEDLGAPVEDLQGAGLVLVVDDEETVRTTAQRALEHWNYRVILAEHGQAAVEVFPEIADRLRAVILDLTMPVMGGEETLAHFRRIRKDVPVILISGYSESEAMRRMRGKGVAAFLQKPFTAEQLAKKLREVLPQVVDSLTVKA